MTFNSCGCICGDRMRWRTGGHAECGLNLPPRRRRRRRHPSPRISPPTLPGGRLVYGQWIGDVGSLFTSNPDGTNITPLLPTGTGEQPRWSPDGRHISIVAENGDGLVFVGLVDPDGSHYVQFDSPDRTLNLGCFDWSPDGLRLACEGWDDTHLGRTGSTPGAFVRWRRPRSRDEVRRAPMTFPPITRRMATRSPLSEGSRGRSQLEADGRQCRRPWRARAEQS